MEKLCSSEGRIGRMQYFLRLVLSTLIVVVVSVLIMFINEQAGLVVYYILIIPTAVFQIIQAIKRFHDMGVGEIPPPLRCIWEKAGHIVGFLLSR